jgi:hypothetical protein
MTKDEFDEIWDNHKRNIILIFSFNTKEKIDKLNETLSIQYELNWFVFASKEKECFKSACDDIERQTSLIVTKLTHYNN